MKQRGRWFTVVSVLTGLGVLGACRSGQPATIDLATAELTQSIASMTEHQLWEAGSALRYDEGEEQKRLCGPARDVECAGHVDAVTGVSPDSGRLNPNGRIVAEFVNVGKPRFGPNEEVGQEAKYGFDKRGLTKKKRYFLVERNTTGNTTGWTWSLVAGVKGSNKPVDLGTPAAFIFCPNDPPNPHYPTARSRFSVCPHVAPHDAAQASASFRDEHHSPAWLECSSGCCTAGS